MSNCFKMGDFVIQGGSSLFWARLELEGEHLAYVRQGFAVKDWAEDVLWLGPWCIQEAVPRNAGTMRKREQKLAGLPAWTKTRWAFVGIGNNKFQLFDCRTGRRHNPICPQAASLLEHIQNRKEGGL